MIEANSLTSITTPQQAVEDLSGEQFLAWVFDYIGQQIGSLPMIRALGKVPTKPEKLRKFLLQIYLAQQSMWGSTETEPGFLKFVLANLSESADPSAENALGILEQIRAGGPVLVHEKTPNPSHLAESWQRLFQSLNITAEELSHIEPKEHTRIYIAELSDIYSNSDWQTAVAAFATQWVIIPHEFQAIWGLVQTLENFDESAFEVIKFLANRTAYVHNLMSGLLEEVSFDQENKQLVWDGVERALSAEEEFLSDLNKYLEI